MARGAAFQEAVAAAAEQLSVCGHGSEGCFAGDPAAYAELMGRQADAGYGVTLQRLAIAATEAGESGVPLEDATVTTWTMAPDEAANAAYLAEQLDRGRTDTVPAYHSKLVDGPQEPLMDQLPAEPAPDDRRAQIINCAYVCGQVGVGNCPILQMQG